MPFLSSLDIGGSALTAQRYRMDVIAQNIANAQVTRTQNGGPYRRKMVVFEERFSDALNSTMSRISGFNGVRVSRVIEDNKPFKLVYDPDHPDADANGYVQMPNVDIVKEMMDMMSATRSYEAGVATVNAVKTMALRALDIGK